LIDLENPIGFRHPLMLVAVTALAKKDSALAGGQGHKKIRQNQQK
jgi:hypothetical protein